MYGSFLQAVQVHLKVKGINGEAINKVQKHEDFLLLVDRAIRRHRMRKFLSQLDPGVLVSSDGES